MDITAARNTPCRAKRPAACRWHGALAEMEAALDRGDRAGYLQAREAAEVAARSNPEAEQFVAALAADRALVEAQAQDDDTFNDIWDGYLADESAAQTAGLELLQASRSQVYLAEQWEQLAEAHGGKPAVDAAETYALLTNEHTPRLLVDDYVADLDEIETEGLLTDAPGLLPADLVAKLVARHAGAVNADAIEYVAIAHLDRVRAADLAFHGEGNLHEFLTHHGWVDDAAFERRVVDLVHRERLDGDSWSQVLPQLGRHARSQAGQLLAATGGGLRARDGLLDNPHLSLATAGAMVSAADTFDLRGYGYLRERLAKHEGLPRGYRLAMGDAAVYPQPGQVDAFEVERLVRAQRVFTEARSAAKALFDAAERDTDTWSVAIRVEERARVAYLNALAAVDAHEQNYALLVSGRTGVRRGLRRSQVGVPEALTEGTFGPHRLEAARGYLLHLQDLRVNFLLL